MRDDEPEGGDPACWSHLFDDTGDPDEAVVDLAALVRPPASELQPRSGAVWTRQSDDLNVNFLVFPAGEGVAEHVNAEVDVLLVGIAGDGIVAIDGLPRVLRAGRAVLIPKGARRSTQAVSDPFAYLTCHRRRAGLWPATQP
jgi:quercetin dioxygenase-like cupin family protein